MDRYIAVMVFEMVGVDEIQNSDFFNSPLEGGLPRSVLRIEESRVIESPGNDWQLMALFVRQLSETLVLSGEPSQGASIRLAWPSMNQSLIR